MVISELFSPVDPLVSADAGDHVSYRESGKLNIRGGYMIVSPTHCHITMNAELLPEEKEYGKVQMLRHRQTLVEQNGGTYWWCVDGADTPHLLAEDPPSR